MPETTTARWTVHRYPRAPLGPQGISYYSLDITPTEYLAVRKDGYGGWEWCKYTILRHNAFGGAQQLASGSATTARAAKAAALAHQD